MIRVGIVGCGAWGRNYLGAVRRTGLGLVTAVLRPSDAVRGDAGLAGVTVASDLSSLLGSVDAVVVASPPSSHLEACVEASRRGLPIMVEKPGTIGLADSLALARCSMESRAPFLVNHVHLFSPAYVRLRDEFITRGRGTPTIRSVGLNHGPFRSYSALWDYGPHDVSMVLGLGLRAVTCESATRTRPDHSPMGSVFDASLAANRGSAIVRFGNGGKTRERTFSVRTPSMSATYDDVGPEKLVVDGSPVPDLDSVPPLDAAVRSFLMAVRTGNTDWRFGPGIMVGAASLLDAVDLLTRSP